ncbi:MAG: hypothetical protein MUQ30_15925, partial [Anaerolineae bacterium]|nr:hypothetical protein [Anaerolineae bacterium]
MQLHAQLAGARAQGRQIDGCGGDSHHLCPTNAAAAHQQLAELREKLEGVRIDLMKTLTSPQGSHREQVAHC